MKGWLFDVQTQDEDLAVWIKTEEGMRKFLTRAKGDFFARAPDLQALKQSIELRGLGHCKFAKGKLFGTDETIDLLQIFPPLPAQQKRVVNQIERLFEYSAELYNADFSLEQRFIFDNELIPTGQVEFETSGNRLLTIRNIDSNPVDYDLPDLSVARLSFVFEHCIQPNKQTRVTRVEANGEVFKGQNEKDVLLRFAEWFREYDPDVVVFDNEAEGYLPILLNRFAINNLNFYFGREPQSFQKAKGKSAWSYNRVVYTAPARYFAGRWHLNSSYFHYEEAGLHGIIELARVSRQLVQRSARTSPGSGVSNMQVYQAYRDGYLIPYKKNQVEELKPASHLLLADRGGLVFEPRLGVHTNCAEIDYSSLFPNIMVLHNISPETMNCECCKEDGEEVPELGYWTCRKRKGLIARILEPVVARRLHYKRLKKIPGPKQGIYEARANSLKWLLVCSFGYTGYKNAKFGRIECHQSICAWSREKLLQATRIAERNGWRVLHGIVDSLWMTKTGYQPQELHKLCEDIRKTTGVDMAIENEYKWFAFLPSNTKPGVPVPTRYFGVNHAGDMKIRGLEVRRHDTPEVVRRFQSDALELLSSAKNEQEYVALAPQIVFLLQRYCKRLEQGKVPLEDLTVEKRTSRPAEDYRGESPTRSVLEQLQAEGALTHPGQHVRFVFVKRGKTLAQKAVALPLALASKCEPDANAYKKLLVRACHSLLAPAGWTREGIEQALERAAYVTLETFMTEV